MKPDNRIAPSILACNLARLAEECSAAIRAGGDLIHFDVMDNRFVPNLSFGAPFLKSLREDGFDGYVDVHLMTYEADGLIESFVEAGANSITIHYEATPHVHRSLNRIRELGCDVGLAVNISTPLDFLPYLKDRLDMLLVMTINPGFGGQALIPAALPKIEMARSLFEADRLSTHIQVDGGVKLSNIRTIADAGADTFVVGSDFFSADDYAERVAQFRAQLA
ncbi:ribulose-phosphate 3-epimerase [Agrobacterium rhizogenes]|uniref:ribulose-phosphate 3-epimerase n=1 Tax=Rhizobium rhizogenes TaxID=359 RepID=UPI001574A662|nr:ribulose-phosphate 3-epimerase [Rhizobium rhizogenes]NTI15513.1 ribulose-phosphate 3-epimerase [Rhizobium rhizogenes]